MLSAKHGGVTMVARGVYRAKSSGTGVEYAHVESGVGHEDMTRSWYEAQRYEPPFDQLPTKEEYEKAKPKNA